MDETRRNFFRVSIVPELASLGEARAFAKDIGARACLGEGRLFDLQVAVSEACASAMGNAASELEIEAWLLSDRIIVEITHDGVLQHDLHADHEHRRPGLDPPLMVALADQVNIVRVSGNKTQVSLTFLRNLGTGLESDVAPESPAPRYVSSKPRLRPAASSVATDTLPKPA